MHSTPGCAFLCQQEPLSMAPLKIKRNFSGVSADSRRCPPTEQSEVRPGRITALTWLPPYYFSPPPPQISKAYCSSSLTNRARNPVQYIVRDNRRDIPWLRWTRPPYNKPECRNGFSQKS